MSTHSDVEKFLQAVFGSDFGTHAVFANLNPAAHVRDFKQLDPKRDCYWSIAAFPPGYTGTNTEDAALNVRALVVDDVGTKGPSERAVRLALDEPTTIVETSAGNFQWGYRLSKPVAKGDWSEFFGGIEALIAHAVPLEARAAQTLMRLPMGLNTKGPDANGKMKLDHGGTFKVRLVKIDPGRVIDPDTITRVAGRSTGAKTSSDGGWVHDIAGLMALIPNNDVHYDDWFAHAERTMAAVIDKDKARPAFEMWSEKSSKHDAAEIERRWPTVDPTRTSGKELLAEAQAADPEGYKAWQARESEAAFPDPSEPPGGGGYKVTPEHMAEEITAAEAGRLGWLDVAPGRWAAFDPVLGRWVRYAGDAVLWAVVKEEMQRRAERCVDAKISAAMDSGKWRPIVCKLLNKEIKLMLLNKNFDLKTDLVGMPGLVLELDYSRGFPQRHYKDGRPGIPEDWVSKSTGVGPGVADPLKWGKKGPCPTWDKFMLEFCSQDKSLVKWWQSFLGYCLSGRTEEHTIVFLYGPGGNGKSVMLDVIGEVLGDYHVRADHRLFMAKGQGNFHLAPLAALEGARLVTVPDVPTGAVWDMGIVKQVTGGGTVTANKMHQDPTSYTPQFKIILAGNEKPRLDNVDEGIRRRMLLVPAMNQPAVADKQLVDKLRAEMPGILRWLIDGWENYAFAGGYKYTGKPGLPFCGAINKATKEYIDGSDVFGRWLGTINRKARGKIIRLTEAHSSWSAFKAGEGVFNARPSNVRDLSSKLKELKVNMDRDEKGAFIVDASFQAVDKAEVFGDFGGLF